MVKNFIIWWRCSVLLILFNMPIPLYAKKKEKAEELYEEPKEEKIDPESTFFITPREVKNNYRKYHRVDRSVTKMDRFMVAEQHHYHLQNLGNNFTAAQYIYYTLPKHIGATSGFSVYDFYFQPAQDIRYYYMPNSRAFTYFNIILANLYSFVLDICYTVRLLDNWHIGGNLRSAMTDNEWPKAKDTKIVTAFPHIDLFTHFKTKNECYHLFTSFSHMKYITDETAGIQHQKYQFKYDEKLPTERYKSSLALLDEEYMIRRITAKYNANNKYEPFSSVGPGTQGFMGKNKDLRRMFYLYHHYELTPQLQFYHELCYNRKNNLSDFNMENQDFITLPLDLEEPSEESRKQKDLQQDTKKSNMSFQSIGNEIGIKGDIERLGLFHNFYSRMENIELKYDASCKPQALPEGIKEESEYYVGCRGRLNLTEKGSHCLHLEGEYLFGGYHSLHTSYKTKFSTLAYQWVKHKVPYIVQYGYPPLRKWDNLHFTPPHAHELIAKADYHVKWIQVNPCVSLKRIYNYIYYTQVEKAESSSPYHHCISHPKQASYPIDLLSWGGEVNFCFFSHYHLDNSILFLYDITSSSTKPHLFKGYMPPWLYTGRCYYAHQPFEKKMDIETGVNIHFKDLYYGDGYDVVSQQFYRQNKFPVQGRPVIDLFLNFRINNLKLSIKYSNITGMIGEPKTNTYFATPFYPSQRAAADIGIHWYFFD